jgi:hypothetical protein
VKLLEIACNAPGWAASATQKKTPQRGRFEMLQCTRKEQAALLKRKFYLVKPLD